VNGCHAKSSVGGPWGVVYRVLNRSVGRMHIFRKAADFEAFELAMVEAHQREPIRILAYCVLSILRYVERNPLSARLVEKAELWRWGSLWSRARGGGAAIKGLLSPWPVSRPANWTARVNASLTAKELGRVRVSIERGRPYVTMNGSGKWSRHFIWSTPSVGRVAHARPIDRSPIRRGG
jgi:hypothetical protein